MTTIASFHTFSAQLKNAQASGDVVTALKQAGTAQTLGRNLNDVERTLLTDTLARFPNNPQVSQAIAALLQNVKIPAAQTAKLGPLAALLGNVVAPPADGGGDAIAGHGIIHTDGPTVLISDFKLSQAALTDMYKGVAAADFGSTRMQLPGIAPYVVHDLQYLVKGGVGMELIPTADVGQTVVDKAGTRVEGSSLMDAALREKMGLAADEPIFALLAYVHPSGHTVTDLKQLGQVEGGFVKTEMGNTHVGAYRGAGRTTNSPADYHSKTWTLLDDGEGYPANVIQVSMQGVAQGLLNKNLATADGVLNNGVKFPGDYKEDIYRTVDINTTLMFYRDWMNDAPHLKDDNSWKTYCAEHKTIVTNIGLNLPHNEAAFVETFGAEGTALWATFKEKFQAANGRAFTPADETSFEPLWKKEGLTAEQIRPWKNLDAYNSYQSARQEGSLANYHGFLPQLPGKGLLAPPETTSDLVTDLVETYVPFLKTNAFYQIATLMGFKDMLLSRMGFGDDKFMELTVPVMKKMLLAEARASAPGTPAGAWLTGAKEMLFRALGAPTDPTAAAQIRGFVEMLAHGLEQSINDVSARPAGDPAKQRQMAAVWLRSEVQADIERDRHAGVADASKVEYYSPPAVFQRIATGMQESSKFVTLKTLCTAVMGEHLEPK